MRFYFLLLLISFGGKSKAQYKLPHEATFKQAVKKMTIIYNSGRKDQRQTVYHFDKKGRLLQKEEYGTRQAFYYPDAETKKPTTAISVGKDGSKSYQTWRLNNKGEELYNASFNDAGFNNLTLFQYNDKGYLRKYFDQYQEISSVDTAFVMQMDPALIPYGFSGDININKFIRTELISYDYQRRKRTDHQFKFDLQKTSEAGNYIKYRINASDVYDGGKGYWEKYKDGLLIEERYVSSGNSLSDFGHRYIYNAGKRVSDTYGYFAGMPSTYMQNNIYTYDRFGNKIRVQHFADNKFTDDYKTVYTYDAQGNWETKKDIFSDNSGSTTTRSFVYYTAGEPDYDNGIQPAEVTALHTKTADYIQHCETGFAAYFAKEKSVSQEKRNNKNFKTLQSANWKDFIEDRWILDSMATGDLNKDGIDDIVLVSQPEKLLKNAGNTKRVLRILFKDAAGTYKLQAESYTAVMPEATSNIFFESVTIKNGVLTVRHEFLRGGSQHIYRFQNGVFALIGAGKINGDASYSDTWDYNLSTGIAVHKYTNDDEITNKRKSSTQKITLKLSQLPVIENYEPLTLKLGEDHL